MKKIIIRKIFSFDTIIDQKGVFQITRGKIQLPRKVLVNCPYYMGELSRTDHTKCPSTKMSKDYSNLIMLYLSFCQQFYVETVLFHSYCVRRLRYDMMQELRVNNCVMVRALAHFLLLTSTRCFKPFCVIVCSTLSTTINLTDKLCEYYLTNSFDKYCYSINRF